MKLKTLIQAGCGFLAFIFIFLPWYNAKAIILGYGGSANAFGETILGVFALLASLAALVWFVLEILNQASVLKLKIPTKTKKIVDICVSGAIVLFGIIGFIVGLASGNEIIKTTPCAGVYLYIIAGVAALVLTFVKLEQTVGKAPKKAEKKEEKKD